jgi:hypothetical protein
VVSAVEVGVVAVGNRGQLIALVCGVVLVLSGCGSSTEGAASPEVPADPTLAAEIPTGFDPCTDIPQEVLDSEGLRNKNPDKSVRSSGAKWLGCLWAQPDGYGVSIRTTNLTLELVRSKDFPDATEFTAGGRPALSARQLEHRPKESCHVNVEMVGGTLEFGLTNPPSRSKTGHMDTCELARALAGKVAPSIPAGA